MDKIDSKKLYQEDIESILLQRNCDWLKFKEKTFLITGATGLIGTVLVDMLVFLNFKFNLNLKLILISRHEKKSDCFFIRYISHDISKPIDCDEHIDYIIHGASNTHPLLYSNFPIETATTNVFGTYNLLNLASKIPGCRFLLVSSVEIYGDDKSIDKSGFKEFEYGFLDCNTSRACYNESKRMSETLCAAFSAEKKVDYVTARLCRVYGPTLKVDDSKALSQFLHRAFVGEDIVLKSEGKQFFSYIYSADAASALIFLLLNGKCGEAYNVADEKSNITLKELAWLVADLAGVKVVFDYSNEIEKKGYSKAQCAILNAEKIQKLGFNAKFDLYEGIKRTLACHKI